MQQFGGAHGIAGRAGYDGAAAMSGLWSPGGPLRAKAILSRSEARMDFAVPCRGRRGSPNRPVYDEVPGQAGHDNQGRSPVGPGMMEEIMTDLFRFSNY